MTNIDIDIREDYTFLSYNNRPGKVIVYLGDNFNYRSFAHHLTLQYLNNHGKGLPTWLTLGIAVYFEDFTLTSGLTRDNRWINQIKGSKKKDLIFTTLLKESFSREYNNFSWLLIDYLIETPNKEYNRLLWDTLSYVKFSDDENKKDIISKSFNLYNFDDELKNYLLSIKDYDDLMKLGVEYYTNGEFIDSIKNINGALKFETDNYSPYYYLGLCYSKLKDYQEAYSYFSIALDKGAPRNIVYYSIGVNFYLNKEFKETKKYLSQIDDPAYIIMSEKILDEISKY